MSLDIKADLETIRNAFPAKEAPEQIVRFADILSGRSVIDIGGGSGAYAQALRTCGHDCFLVDIDLSYLKEAQSKGIDVARMSAEKLAVRDASFETALLVEVIEHVNDTEGTLSEAARVATQNVLLTTPNHDSYFWLRDRGLFTEATLPPDHLHFFTKATLDKLLAGIFRSHRVLYGEPISLYPQTRPLAFKRLYAEACTSGTAQLRISRQEQLVEGYREPSGPFDILPLTDPLGKLLLLYRARPDLQSAFPEVDKGDYLGLLKWATDQAYSRKDSASAFLAEVADWYKRSPWSQLERNVSEEQKETRIKNLERELLRHREQTDELRADLLKGEAKLTAQKHAFQNALALKAIEYDNSLYGKRREFDEALAEKERAIHAVKADLEQAEARLRFVTASVTWGLLASWQRFERHLLPPGSRREAVYLHFIDRLRKAIRT